MTHGTYPTLAYPIRPERDCQLLSHTRSPHPLWNRWSVITLNLITPPPPKHKVISCLPTNITFITTSNWILGWLINWTY
jgi:hypothetical protein